MKNEGISMTANWNYIIISVVIFAILSLVVIYLPEYLKFDANLLHSIRLALSPYPIAIPTFASSFGYETHLLWPQIVLSAVLISHKKFIKTFLLVFFMQATYFLTHYIKELVCRERPTEMAGFSFPSMHSSLTMCFYGIVIFLVLKNVNNKFWRYFLATLAGVWIILVGVSRMWLGAHYPVDVLAGMLLGFVMVNLFIILTKFFSRA